MIALQFKYQPRGRGWRWGGGLNGPFNDLGRWRLAHPRLVIVIRIIVRRKVRTAAGKSARAAQVGETWSHATAPRESRSSPTSGGASNPAVSLGIRGGHKNRRSEHGKGQHD